MANQSKLLDLPLLANEILRRFPEINCAYLFGSAAADELRDDSDLDIALLQFNALVPSDVISLKGYLSERFRRDSDIVDLFRADSVTAAQVVTTGIEILNLSPRQVADFETMALSRYALLNEERSEILKDIEMTGTIYGR